MKPTNNAKPIRLDTKTQVFMLAQIFPESFRKFQTYIMKKSNQAPPPEKHPELKNLSTEKPVLDEEQFSNIKLHEIICSGIAYYAMGGYNRQGIGTPKQFVAVMGGASWAIYIGTPLQSVDVIAQEGDNVAIERHVTQLIDCEETLPYYRFNLKIS